MGLYNEGPSIMDNEGHTLMDVVRGRAVVTLYFCFCKEKMLSYIYINCKLSNVNIQKESLVYVSIIKSRRIYN